jgi:excisionase family DNA binding protein
MKNSNSWITPREAAEITGFSNRHILNLIERGELSCTMYGKRYRIDKSELFRVFPEAHNKVQEKMYANKNAQTIKIETENEYLMKMIEEKDKIIAQKDKEIEFLRNQIENCNNDRKDLIEKIPNQTKLIQNSKSDATLVSTTKSWTDVFRRKK